MIKKKLGFVVLALAVIPVEMVAQKPVNIVLIMTDQQRYDQNGFMGHPVVKTPNLDILASKGLVLENAFTASTICVPSRTSIITGKYVHRTAHISNEPDEHVSPDEWSFMNVLKDKGYKIGIAGKNHMFTTSNLKVNFDFWEETSHWGKNHGNITESDKKVNAYLRQDPRPGYENSIMLEGLVPGPMPFPEEECPAYRIAEDGMDFLEKHKEDPFFLYFSFGDPHWPTVVPEPYYSMYDPKDVIMKHADFDWKNNPFKHYVQSQAVGYAEYTDEEKRRIIATYYGQITYTDKAIGMFLDKLQALGLDKNTIVVFMSDHGDWGGNYGIVAKTGGFQETLIRVPAILKFPDIKTPKRIDAQVSTIDVLPTVFDYLGYSYPQAVQGKSFWEVIKGQRNDHRDVIFCEVGDDRPPPLPMSRAEFLEVRKKREKEDGMFWFVDYTIKGRSVMIRRDDWKFIYNTGFMNELYDIKNDPYELNNLIDKRKYREKQKALESELIKWLLREPVVGV